MDLDKGCQYVRAGPATYLPCGGVAGGRTGSEIMRAGELFLLLTLILSSCKTQQRGFCTTPGQHNRASPAGVRAVPFPQA